MALSLSLARDLEPGEVVCGEFVIERALPPIALGRVFTARRRAGGERVTVWSPRTSGNGSVEAFRAQMERHSAITHRALAPILGSGVERVGPVIVYRRLAEGITVREALSEGPLARGEAGWLMCEVAAALEIFHAMRPTVAHRALCPELISLVPGGGAVQIEGAGVLQCLSDSGWIGEHAEDFTDPAYLSPDVLLDRVDPRMDTFVLASIAYECLTGARAFADAMDHTAVLKGPYPRASATLPDLAPAVDDALTRAWTPSREKAFESTTAFAMELAHALMTDRPRTPPPMPVMKPGQSGVRRAPSDPEARPIGPELSFQEIETALSELWANDVPGTRKTQDWKAVPQRSGPPAETRSAPPRAALGDAPLRPTSPFPRTVSGRPILPVAAETTLPLHGTPIPTADDPPPPEATRPQPSEPPTLAPPPAYPAWAGRVSRPNASVDALRVALPPMAAAPVPTVHPQPAGAFVPKAPVAPEGAVGRASAPSHPSPLTSATTPATTPVATPAEVPAPMPGASVERLPAPAAVPSIRVRRSNRPAPGFLSSPGLSRAVARGMTALSLAVVLSATIVTLGQVYIARGAHNAPTITVNPPPLRPTITVTPPSVAAPIVAPAPAPVVAAPAPSPVVAAPVPVGQPTVVPPAVVATPTPTPAPTPTPTPATTAEGTTELTPFAGIPEAFRARMESAVASCFGAVRGHHMRFRVRYTPTGTPSLVAVRGVFANTPNVACIESAARGLELPRESRGVLVVDYVFTRPLRAPAAAEAPPTP